MVSSWAVDDENRGDEKVQQEDLSSKRPLFSLSLPPMKSPENYGWTLTPPHHTASIPFRWEEQPGKPIIPCRALSLLPSKNSPYLNNNNNNNKKSLELPPRLLYNGSPTTVLKDPYVGKSIFHSFRLSRDRVVIRSSSFDGGGWGNVRRSSPERDRIVMSKRRFLSNESGTGERGREKVGLSRLWKRKAFGLNRGGQMNEVEDGFVISSEDMGGSGDGVDTRRIAAEKRKSFFLGLTKAKSDFWATIYGAVKQVVIPTTTRRRKTNRCKKKDY